MFWYHPAFHYRALSAVVVSSIGLGAESEFARTRWSANPGFTQPAAPLGVTLQTRDGRRQPSSVPRSFSQRLDDVAAVGQLRLLAFLQGRLQHSLNVSQILEPLIDFHQPVFDE